MAGMGRFFRTADLPVGWIVGFQPADRSPIWRAPPHGRSADWEIGDPTGWETGGTPAQDADQVQAWGGHRADQGGGLGGRGAGGAGPPSDRWLALCCRNHPGNNLDRFLKNARYLVTENGRTGEFLIT